MKFTKAVLIVSAGTVGFILPPPVWRKLTISTEKNINTIIPVLGFNEPSRSNFWNFVINITAALSFEKSGWGWTITPKIMSHHRAHIDDCRVLQSYVYPWNQRKSEMCRTLKYLVRESTVARTRGSDGQGIKNHFRSWFYHCRHISMGSELQCHWIPIPILLLKFAGSLSHRRGKGTIHLAWLMVDQG